MHEQNLETNQQWQCKPNEWKFYEIIITTEQQERIHGQSIENRLHIEIANRIAL